jgi:hypothetical protein
VRVRQGWSGEVKPNVWAKFDVELEEEDLRRLLAASPLGGNGVPGELSTTLAYRLLEVEAERLVTVKLVTRYGFDYDAGTTKINELTGRRDHLVEDILRQSEAVPA